MSIILCEKSQKKILLGYLVDYNLLIQSYQKIDVKEPDSDLEKVNAIAINLYNEIINRTNSRKNCFSDENAELANNIAKIIQLFIQKKLNKANFPKIKSKQLIKNNKALIKLPAVLAA